MPMTPCIESRRTPSQTYPMIKVHGRMVQESRFVWAMAKGAVPAGLWVLHHCDNPRCIRLDHLFLGTHVDNMADMIRKGRSAAGFATGNGRKTHCPQGHAYDEANTYRSSKGYRFCRACHRERSTCLS